MYKIQKLKQNQENKDVLLSIAIICLSIDNKKIVYRLLSLTTEEEIYRDFAQKD